jgi:hypothetical protein
VRAKYQYLTRGWPGTPAAMEMFGEADRLHLFRIK